MKAGTTSLFHYLASHPEVVAPRIKELDFFRSPEDFAKGVSWYESQFAGSGSVAFEASTNYSKRSQFPGVPERIRCVLSEPKLVYILRDPIERMVSNYVHNYAKGWKMRPFAEEVRRERYLIDSSRYYYQLEAYLQYFDLGQILLLETERMEEARKEVLDETFQFLGLSTEFDPEIVKTRYHESNHHIRPNPLELVALRRLKLTLLRRVVSRVFSPWRRTIARPVVDDQTRRFLEEALRDDIIQLRSLSGKKFDRWRI